MGDFVLITGGDGFVGRHLRRELGGRAVATDADVTDVEDVSSAVRDVVPAAVVHLAARSSVSASWESPSETWRINAIGTVNVLEAVRREQATARVLVASTGEVYGRAARIPTNEDSRIAPLSPYAASKAAAEIAAERARRADGIDVVVARAFPHTGPGQDERFAVGSWTRQIAALELSGGGSLHVGDLSVRRDITDVRDVCRAYIHLLDPRVPAGTYNVASGTAVPLAGVVDLLASMARCPITVETDGERLRPADVPVLCGDASHLASATGWRPRIPLETMLRDTLDEARRSSIREPVIRG